MVAEMARTIEKVLSIVQDFMQSHPNHTEQGNFNDMTKIQAALDACKEDSKTLVESLACSLNLDSFANPAMINVYVKLINMGLMFSAHQLFSDTQSQMLELGPNGQAFVQVGPTTTISEYYLDGHGGGPLD